MSVNDLAGIAIGHPVRGSIDQLQKGRTGIVQMRDVDIDRGVDWSTVAMVELPGKREPDYLRPDDIVFTTRGLRNVAVVIGATPFPAVCAPNMFVIRLRDNRACLPEYLAWFMNQKPAQSYFQREATGTSIQNIRREVVENLQVPLAPLVQQKTIAAFEKAARRERALLTQLIQSTEKHMEVIAMRLAGSDIA